MKVDGGEFFDETEVEAVRECFGDTHTLPSPVVERVLELRLRRVIFDDTLRTANIKWMRRNDEFYKDGKLRLARGWHEMGEKRYEFHFNNMGIMHGLHIAWYSNGQIMFKGELVNGLKTEFTHYDSNGTKMQMRDHKLCGGLSCHFQRYYDGLE